MAKRGPKTKYTPTLIKKMKEYLTSWAKDGDVIPTVEGLSIYLDISRDTIYTWKKQEEKKEISDTLGQIEKTQKNILMNKGLLGEFNSNITKLLLHNHGLSDKAELKTENTTKVNHGLTPELLDKINEIAG